MEETVIISLGGSLIVPEGLDIDFIKDFKKLIVSQVALGKRFVIITGGGKTCRTYQKAARELGKPTAEDLDWIGIASLKLNAEFLRVVFGEYAHDEVIEDLSAGFPFVKPIVIGSALEPGHSTDFDAVLGAKTLGAKKIVNVSNTDYVYDSDPRTNPGARKIEKISWKEFRAIIPGEWDPGLNSPFDPIASKLAEEEGMSVAILNGKPLINLEKYLSGEKFAGTIIS